MHPEHDRQDSSPRYPVVSSSGAVPSLNATTIMKKHEWREKTEEGETRLVTATRHAGKWQLQSRLKSEDEWTKFEKIELDDLESLLDIVERKYQRNRVPHEHVLEIEKMIAAAQPKKK